MMRILVVDDVRFFRHYLDRLLRQHGYEVETASSGRLAAKLLEEGKTFDVVLTDLVMPEMEGRELIETVRDHSSETTQAGPAFILMTALGLNATAPRSTETVQGHAQRLGFQDVLPKPLDEQGLFDTLTAIDNRSREWGEG